MRARWREDGASHDVEVSGLNSTLCGASAIPARTAEQCPVATPHKLHAVAGEANGHLPDGITDPGGWIDLMLWEEMFGDDAIYGAGVPRIDGAEHLAGALASLRGHPWVGRDTSPCDGCPEARQSSQPIGGEIVQGDHCGERTVPNQLGEADVEGMAAYLKLDQRGVPLERCVATQFIRSEMEAFGRRRTGFEQDRGRICLRGPEDWLDEGGGLRVGCEIATPIAVQTPRRPFR